LGGKFFATKGYARGKKGRGRVPDCFFTGMQLHGTGGKKRSVGEKGKGC